VQAQDVIFQEFTLYPFKTLPLERTGHFGRTTIHLWGDTEQGLFGSGVFAQNLLERSI